MPTETSQEPTLAAISRLRECHRWTPILVDGEYDYDDRKCAECDEDWPCDVAILLSAIEKLEKVAEAARGLRDALDRYWDREGMKVIHAGVGQAHCDLEDALAALEGKPRKEENK